MTVAFESASFDTSSFSTNSWSLETAIIIDIIAAEQLTEATTQILQHTAFIVLVNAVEEVVASTESISLEGSLTAVNAEDAHNATVLSDIQLTQTLLIIDTEQEEEAPLLILNIPTNIEVVEAVSETEANTVVIATPTQVISVFSEQDALAETLTNISLNQNVLSTNAIQEEVSIKTSITTIVDVTGVLTEELCEASLVELSIIDNLITINTSHEDVVLDSTDITINQLLTVAEAEETSQAVSVLPFLERTLEIVDCEQEDFTTSIELIYTSKVDQLNFANDVVYTVRCVSYNISSVIEVNYRISLVEYFKPSRIDICYGVSDTAKYFDINIAEETYYNLSEPSHFNLSKSVDSGYRLTERKL